MIKVAFVCKMYSLAKQTLHNNMSEKVYLKNEGLKHVTYKLYGMQFL